MSERPQTRARKRQGRCYTLAWKSLTSMEDAGDWCLAHGEVNMMENDDSFRAGHAWLESETEVFDPVINKIFDRAVFYRSRRPTKLNRFSRTEAANMILEQGSYGPWSDNVLTR